MMNFLRPLVVLLVCAICLNARADDDTPASSDPSVHIQFRGYQRVAGGYLFQLYMEDLPANQQPSLKKIGDPVGIRNLVVGSFSLNIFKTSLDGGTPTQVDASTLELDDPKTGHKVVLTYRATGQAPGK
jgi:hypothetical protein